MSSTLVVNEVLYDPSGPDAGGEYVELLNVSSDPIVLAATVRIESGNGAEPNAWRAFWSGDESVLAPGAYLTVGDDPRSDRHATPGLQNGPDACRIVDGEIVVDRVGWGTHAFSEYFEGAPAPDPSPGLLVRRPDGRDSGVNADDFVPATVETPGALNVPRRRLEMHAGIVPTDPPLPRPGERFAIVLEVHASGLEAVGSEGGVEDLVSGRHVLLGRPLPPGGRRTLSIDLGPREAGEGTAALSTIGADVQPATLEVRYRVGLGSLVVSEIQARPGDDGPEWIELAARAFPVDPEGFRLADAALSLVTIDAAAPIVVPGAPIVFTRDAATLLVRHADLDPARVHETMVPTLNDRDEQVHVIDPQGRLTDSVAFDAPAGRSLERVSLDLMAAVPGAFVAAPFGPTPGRPNGARADPPETPALDVRPRVIGGDGAEIVFHLGIEPSRGARTLVLLAVDPTGRVRGEILRREGAWPGGIRWDGRIDGRPLPNGLYVLLARAELADGTRVERRTAFAIDWGVR